MTNKHKSAMKFLQDFEKKISKIVDEMINAHSSPAYMFMSEADRTFIKYVFMAGFKMGKENK